MAQGFWKKNRIDSYDRTWMKVLLCQNLLKWLRDNFSHMRSNKYICHDKVDDTGVEGGRVVEIKGKKERLSKHKLVKDWYQCQNDDILAILERLKFKKFSFGSIMAADNTFHCPMVPPLWNPFHRPCIMCKCIMLMPAQGQQRNVETKPCWTLW